MAAKAENQNYFRGPENSARVRECGRGIRATGAKRSLRQGMRYKKAAVHKPNKLANRMIAAGILALEREDPDYDPDFVIEYRQKVVIPKIDQYQIEKKLAEGFNPYSNVPKELESDGWAFMGILSR
jgi:hypothetical protein